jgi:hypothetical protein
MYIPTTRNSAFAPPRSFIGTIELDYNWCTGCIFPVEFEPYSWVRKGMLAFITRDYCPRWIPLLRIMINPHLERGDRTQFECAR